MKRPGPNGRIKRAKVQGQHGYSKPLSPTYSSWQAMKQRCYNRQNVAYPRYGAKGVRVIKRWYHDFREFLKDMGERPEGHELDRIDNTKGYRPSNCRWSPERIQAENRSTTIIVTWRGETRSLTAWARKLGLNPGSLRVRWNRGKRGNELFKPARKRTCT